VFAQVARDVAEDEIARHVLQASAHFTGKPHQGSCGARRPGVVDMRARISPVIVEDMISAGTVVVRDAVGQVPFSV
jgi:hypothetical protein